MNNGGRNSNPNFTPNPNPNPNPLMQLATLPPVVSPQIYAQNRSRIHQLRDALGQFEAQNEAGIQRFLEGRVNEGIQAHNALLEMRSRGLIASAGVSYTSPNGNVPSSSTQIRSAEMNAPTPVSPHSPYFANQPHPAVPPQTIHPSSLPQRMVSHPHHSTTSVSSSTPIHAGVPIQQPLQWVNVNQSFPQAPAPYYPPQMEPHIVGHRAATRSPVINTTPQVNTGHIASNISGPSNIPISTSSALDGALGPPPARTSQQAKQVKTTYSSGKSSGVAAPAAERTQNETLNPQDSQQKVIEFFKICPSRFTKYVMERVIARLNARAQPPDTVPLIYRDPHTNAQENLTPAVNLVMTYLSVMSDQMKFDTLMRVKTNLLEATQQRVPTESQPQHQPQQVTAAQPTMSRPSIRPVPVSSSQILSTNFPHHTSVTSGSNIPPVQPSIPVATPVQAHPHMQNTPNLSAELRHANGPRVQEPSQRSLHQAGLPKVATPQLVPEFRTSTSNSHSVEANTSRQTSVQSIPPPPPPSLVSQSDSISPRAVASGSTPSVFHSLKPSDADYSRLAFDILRALGRPTTLPGIQTPAGASSKRKRDDPVDKSVGGSSTSAPTPVIKKQKVVTPVKTIEAQPASTSQDISIPVSAMEGMSIAFAPSGEGSKPPSKPVSVSEGVSEPVIALDSGKVSLPVEEASIEEQVVLEQGLASEDVSEAALASKDVSLEQAQSTHEASFDIPMEGVQYSNETQGLSGFTAPPLLMEQQVAIIGASGAPVASNDVQFVLPPPPPPSPPPQLDMTPSSIALIPQQMPIVTPDAVSYVVGNAFMDLTMPPRSSPPPTAFLEEIIPSSEGEEEEETIPSSKAEEEEEVIPSSEAEEEEDELVESHSRSSSISQHTPTRAQDDAPSKSKRETLPLFLPSLSPSKTPTPTMDEDVVRATPESSHAFVLDADLLRPGTPRESSQVRDTKGKGKQSVWDEDEVEIVSRSRSSRASSTRSQAYVLVPPLPAWAKRYKAKEERRNVPRREASPEIIEVEDSDNAVVAEVDEAQWRQDVVVRSIRSVAYKGARKVQCPWRDCGAPLDSWERLSHHAKVHAQENEHEFQCKWQGWQECGLTFSGRVQLAEHLETHTDWVMICAFEGCSKTFTTGIEYLQHHNSASHRNGILRRPPRPVEPSSSDLPPLPGEVATYLLMPISVVGHPLPRRQHLWLGAKVLENLTCRSQRKRTDATRPVRGVRRLAERIREIELQNPDPEVARMHVRRMAHDEYDAFAQDTPRRFSKPFDELPSAEVTHQCAKGLVFWLNGEDDVDADVDDARTKTEDLDIDGLGFSHADETSIVAAIATLEQYEAEQLADGNPAVVAPGLDVSYAEDTDPSVSGAADVVSAPDGVSSPLDEQIQDKALPAWTTLSASPAEVESLL